MWVGLFAVGKEFLLVTLQELVDLLSYCSFCNRYLHVN